MIARLAFNDADLEEYHDRLLTERDRLHRSLKAVNGNLDAVRAERLKRTADRKEKP